MGGRAWKSRLMTDSSAERGAAHAVCRGGHRPLAVRPDLPLPVDPLGPGGHIISLPADGLGLLHALEARLGSFEVAPEKLASVDQLLGGDRLPA